jgi:hypothetical protein
MIGMFGDPAGDIAGQRLAGQFAITKYIDLMKYGWMMFGHLVGHTDSEKGINIEGWYEKPTDSSENLQAIENFREYVFGIRSGTILLEEGTYKRAGGGVSLQAKVVEAEVKILHTFIEAFGRLDKVLKLMRVMHGDVMNKQGLIMPDKDIFMADGSFNPEINWDDDTGTSRHMEEEVFNRFIEWLVSPKGGCVAYPGEADLFQLLKEKSWIDQKLTRAQWIFKKLGR